MAWWPVLAPAPLPGWLPAVDEGEGESGAVEEEAPARVQGQREGLHTHVCTSSPEFTVEFTPGHSFIQRTCRPAPACLCQRETGRGPWLCP